MTRNEVLEKIKIDEFDGEKLICKFRIVIAIIFFLSVPFICLMKVLNGESAFPIHAYFCCVIFLIYSIGVHFYLKNRNSVPHLYKYICVIIDVIIHSASIWIGCTYPDVAPAITYLSNWALFFLVLIMLGAFRYSVPCAYFSGIFADLQVSHCYSNNFLFKRSLYMLNEGFKRRKRFSNPCVFLLCHIFNLFYRSSFLS